MASTPPEHQPENRKIETRVTTFVNRVSPRKVDPLTVRKYLRRLVTLVLWPSIDIIVTIFSNYLILRFNAFVATSATILVMIVLNGALLYLLLLELDLSDWIRAKTDRLEKIRRFVEATERRRNLVILLRLHPLRPHDGWSAADLAHGHHWQACLYRWSLSALP